MAPRLSTKYTKTLASFRCYSTKPSQLEAAFRESNAHAFLAAAPSKESIPKFPGRPLPEIIVAGRANVGKSTLLNAILGRNGLVNTSKKAGRTRALNFFRVGSEPGKMILVDAPGYGKRGRAEWGELWEHYIDTRAQLRQICVLINAGHGLTDFDQAMLSDLTIRLSEQNGAREQVPVLQPILTKIDTLDTNSGQVQDIIKAVQSIAPAAAPPLLCAMRSDLSMGVDAVRRSMVGACSARN